MFLVFNKGHKAETFLHKLSLHAMHTSLENQMSSFNIYLSRYLFTKCHIKTDAVLE